MEPVPRMYAENFLQEQFTKKKVFLSIGARPIFSEVKIPYKLRSHK